MVESVDDLFAPPGNVWQPVSSSLPRMRRTMLAAGSAVVLLAVVVAALLIAVPLWIAVLVATVVVAGAVAGWVAIGRNARWWGYAERDEDLYIRRGLMFRTLVVVPYGRMQYVDVHAGPLDQAFGVASVHLHTASPGTSARIPGLPKDEAARLRDKLTALGQAQAAGL